MAEMTESQYRLSGSLQHQSPGMQRAPRVALRTKALIVTAPGSSLPATGVRVQSHCGGPKAASRPPVGDGARSRAGVVETAPRAGERQVGSLA